MKRALVLVLVPLVLAACVPAGRVKTLEKRIAELEKREAERELETNGALLRIEAQLAALAIGYARLGEAGVEDLTVKLAQLEARLAQVARPPTRPTARGPDPSKVYAVPVAGAPMRGSPDALVTVVRAGEYACPYCEKTRATMDELLRLYGGKLRIVHLDYIVHPTTATDAARAACAAHKQGKFWEMDEILWEQAFKTRQFDLAHIENLAAGIGLDLDRLRADAAGPCASHIRNQMATLTAMGVGATPAFFINGRFLSGAQPLPAFRALVDEELKLAEERVKKSGKKKRYYDDWVMGKGLTKLEPPAPAP